MRMRFLLLGLVAASMAALTVIEPSDAQPPGKKGPPFDKKGKGGPRPVTADQLVERIMSFDKNDDGKIAVDELPERMQHLVALGDVKKDGALDRDEIRKLATTLESFAGLTGGPGPGPGSGGPPPKKGKGGGPKGPAKGFANDVQRTLDDLNVTGAARDKADRAVRAHQDKTRRFDELLRAELMLQMKDALNEEDFRVLKTALDRPGPGGFKGPRPPDLNVRIEQLQKELDELRKKLPK